MSLSAETKEKLKRARELRGVSPELLARQKENIRIQKAILEGALEPISVPDLAQNTGISSEIVFWHVNALRKYDKMVDVKKSGDYWLYKKK
jgi:biotin operon repressor